MIRKRGSKWYFRTDVVINGEVKRVERVGGKTKRECQLALAKFETDVSNGILPTITTGMTINKFSEVWLNSHGLNITSSTKIIYQSVLDNHIIPALGKKHISDISPIDVQKFVNNLGDYKITTKRLVLKILHSMLEYAIFPCGYITVNPSSKVRIPRDESQNDNKVSVWSAAEVKKIMSSEAELKEWYIIVALMYHTGCRIGEILAIKWENVDFDKMIIHINAIIDNSGEYKKRTKTKTSTREVTFSSKLYDVLIKEKKRQDELSKELDIKFDFVCSNNLGKHFVVAGLNQLRRWLKKNFGHGTLHTFRHTHCSMLLDAGEDIDIVSKRLGHSSIVTTSKVYSHVLNKRNKKLLSTLESF